MLLSFEKNWFRKTWYKFTDREKYKAYKERLAYVTDYNAAYSQLYKFIEERKELIAMEAINKIESGNNITTLHSGNAGDIIYSLPVVKKIAEITGRPVNYLLKLNEPLRLAKEMTHPLNNVMLNTKMAEGLIPLLTSQTYINDSSVFEDQPVDINLSAFRESGLDLNKCNIARWNFYITGIYTNLSEPWLDIEPDKEFSNHIVLARSSRYNNPFINYSFLADYPDLVFIGVKDEYEQMKQQISNLRWHPVNDFLEMARLIAGSKLFIGNQSFPFSIA